MTHQKLQVATFLVLLAAVSFLVLMMWLPFIKLLAFAVILAILFHPLYNRLVKQLQSPNLVAGFVVAIIALIIAGPVFLLGQQVYFELAGFYNSLHLNNLAGQSGAFSRSLPLPLQQLAISFNVDLNAWLSQLTSQAFTTLSGLLSGLGWLFGSLIVAGFSVFFLLRDGDKITKLLAELLPLSRANENILFQKLSDAVGGVVRGQFLVVLTISTASFIGFSIFGLPNALLWACLMFVAAFVPTFGTSLVFVPAVAFLFFTGHIGAAVGMTVWACASVVLIDNILSAKIISSKVRLHPLLTIFGILGGLTVFGPLGVLLGPVIMAVFAAMINIYRTDLKENLEK